MKAVEMQSQSPIAEAPSRPVMPARPAALERQRRSSIGVSARRGRAPGTVRTVGNIRLMEGWTSNNPDATFTNQTFEIRQETKTAHLGIDGRLLITCCPTNVTWYGGKAADFEHIVHVKIVSRGVVLIDDAVCTRRGLPREVPGGVSFDVAEITD
jgi:hypothetical protein